MKKVVFELPFYRVTCGGVVYMVKLAEKLKDFFDVEIRFQRFCEEFNSDIAYSYGLPNDKFPECDYVVTYGDNPYIDELCELKQIGKVFVLMLSFGMAIDRERKCASHPKVTVLVPSKRTENLLLKEGIDCINIGHGFDLDSFVNKNYERKNYLALLYHHNIDKRYKEAVVIADQLYKDGVIEGVITFGTNQGYENYNHPIGLVKHYSNATKEEVIEVFNQCKCYYMPSVTEGLNMTPIESTLCGCPTVLCDGAIGEIFINHENSFCLEKENLLSHLYYIDKIIDNFNDYSIPFMKHMQNIIKEHTYERTIKELMKLL